MKRLIPIILTAFLFQGCLIDRLEQSRKHLCSNQIVLSLEDSIAITFYTPILYPEDIIKILGARPSEIKSGAKILSYRYRLVKKNDASETFAVPLVFDFVEIDGRFYLSRVVADKKIDDIFPPALVESLFSKACYARLIGTRIEVGFEDVDLNSMPTMADINMLLGAPHLEEQGSSTYFFELLAADKTGRETAVVVIDYDPLDQKPLKVVVTFFHYRIDVDLVEKIAVGQLKNLGTAFRLGLTIAVSK